LYVTDRHYTEGDIHETVIVNPVIFDTAAD